MRSTQLVESCNSTVRGFLSPDKTIVEFFLHFERLLQSRRRAERDADFAARNTRPCNNFEYSNIVNKAALQYTPKMFAIFQEQYGRVQEYKLQPLVSDMDNGLYSFVVYKLHNDERLDDRVVTSDVSAEEIRCDCKWWDTMGILCRHSLTVMHIQATFGHDKFSTLPDAYILSRWTRGERSAYAYLYVARPLTREEEEEEERYVRLHGKFGAIVKAVYRIEELQQFINTAADTLATQVQHALSVYDARTAPLRAQHEVPQTGVVPNSTSNPSQEPVEVTASAQTAKKAGKSIATKFPRQTKPSKNSKRYKANNA
ncbi:Protein FAR1-RELATED SEQUENCE 5 [Linum grandiflorum]